MGDNCGRRHKTLQGEGIHPSLDATPRPTSPIPAFPIRGPLLLPFLPRVRPHRTGQLHPPDRSILKERPLLPHKRRSLPAQNPHLHLRQLLPDQRSHHPRHPTQLNLPLKMCRLSRRPRQRKRILQQRCNRQPYRPQLGCSRQHRHLRLSPSTRKILQQRQRHPIRESGGRSMCSVLTSSLPSLSVDRTVTCPLCAPWVVPSRCRTRTCSAPAVRASCVADTTSASAPHRRCVANDNLRVKVCLLSYRAGRSNTLAL